MKKGGMVQCGSLGFCMFLLSTSLYCSIFSKGLEFHRGHVSPIAGSNATLHYFEVYTMKLSLYIKRTQWLHFRTLQWRVLDEGSQLFDWRRIHPAETSKASLNCLESVFQIPLQDSVSRTKFDLRISSWNQANFEGIIPLDRTSSTTLVLIFSWNPCSHSKKHQAT